MRMVISICLSVSSETPTTTDTLSLQSCTGGAAITTRLPAPVYAPTAQAGHLRYPPTRVGDAQYSHRAYAATVSAYDRTRRCPVLRWRIVLSTEIERLLRAGGGGCYGTLLPAAAS
eukprot:239028-Rhodomonas_salina.1